MPGLANFFTQAPLFSDVIKLVVGIAPQRRMPPFAEQTFKDWFSRRSVRNAEETAVMLWAGYVQ